MLMNWENKIKVITDETDIPCQDLDTWGPWWLLTWSRLMKQDSPPEWATSCQGLGDVWYNNAREVYSYTIQKERTAPNILFLEQNYYWWDINQLGKDNA